MKRFGMTSAGGVTVGGGIFVLTYVLLQYGGLFGPSPESFMRVLHQWPVLAGVFVLMGASTWDLAAILRPSGGMTHSSRWQIIFYIGMLLIGTGIFVSSLTRFEGMLVLTEGQSSSAAREALDSATLYVRKFSHLPAVDDVTMLTVAPFGNVDGGQSKRLRAVISIRKGRSARELHLDSLVPTLFDGFFYRIGKVGYSPHFRLFNAGGDIVEDAYAVLRIFPAGMEDSFRLPLNPYTYYLRYYPDAAMAPAQAGIPAGMKGPLYKVRVARNLDLVANSFVAPGELVSFDGMSILFYDARRWAQISIVWDPGLFLIIPGLIFLLSGGVGMLIGRNMDRGGTRIK